MEAYTISGEADMMCRVVARSNADLQRVLDLVVADRSIERSSTTIALSNRISHRVLPLLHAAAGAPRR
jgi:DNA-binding Lrp family transcriptional regulator